jgi:hypothetical protein
MYKTVGSYYISNRSGDTTARLWKLPNTIHNDDNNNNSSNDNSNDNSNNNGDGDGDDVQTLKDAIVLDHSSEHQESKDVTALDWNVRIDKFTLFHEYTLIYSLFSHQALYWQQDPMTDRHVFGQ